MNIQNDNQKADYFELHAQQILSHEAFNQLIELRNSYLSQLYQIYDINPSLTGKELNAMHNEFFHQVSELIGAEKYELLFGITSNEEVHLIDEKIFDEQQALRKQ